MATIPPLLPKAPPVPFPSKRPRITSVRAGIVVSIGVVVVALAISAALLLGSRKPVRGHPETPKPRPAATTMRTQTVDRFPKDYSALLRPAEATPTPGVATPIPEVTLPPQAIPLERTTQPGTPPAAPAAATPGIPLPSRPGVSRPVPTPPVPPKRTCKAGPDQAKECLWPMFASTSAQVQSGQAVPDPKPPGEPPATSPLLKPATWIRPRDVTRVLYRSQVIPGLTLGQINSDIPQSDVRIMVTRPVLDRWGINTLIPQNTLLVGATKGGQVAFGQVRLDFTIEQAHYPDGTILDLNKAKLSDASGQAGLAGSVDNHLLQLGIAALLSAAVNVGARAPLGSQQGFSERLDQQYAGQVGQSLGRSGEQVIQQRYGNVRPTIRLPEASEVTITLQDNLSFAKEPVVIR